MKLFKNQFSFKKIMKSLIAATLTIIVEILSVTFIVQIISGFYQVAINHQLNVFDLTILSTFTGATCGVIISKIASIYRFIRRRFDLKKGETTDEK